MPAIFDRSIRVQTGFYDAYLKGIKSGLEEVVGPTATNESELNQLLLEVETTELWHVGKVSPGQFLRLEVMAEPGAGGLYASTGLGSTSTPNGILLLNKSAMMKPGKGPIGNSRLLTWTTVLPQSLPLGAQMHFQGIGGRIIGGYGWTNLLTLTIVNLSSL